MFNWFNNLKVKKKLLYSYILLILFMLAIGGTGIYNMKSIETNVESFAQNYVPSTDLLLQIDRDMHQALVGQRSMIYTQPGSEEFNKLKDFTLENMGQVKERWAKYIAIEHNIDEKNFYSEFEARMEKWQEVSNQFISVREQDTSVNAVISVNFSLNEGAAAFDDARNIIDKLTEITETESQKDFETSQASYDNAITMMAAGMAIIIIFSLFSGYEVTRSVGAPLEKATEMIAELQKGHLKHRLQVKTKDEIGQLSISMNALADSQQEFAKVMYAVADGELSNEIKLRSDDDEMSPPLNKIIYTLRDLHKETGILAAAASNGKLNVRGNENKFNGGYKEIIKGFNNTLNAIITPINEGVDALKKIAGGDLTVKVTGEHKGDFQLIQDSINSVTDSLGGTLSKVSHAVEATLSSSSQISSSTEQMAAGAQEQSSQTSEIATAIEEMTRTIIETTRNATAAAENAQKAGRIAGEGDKAVSATVEGMKRIADVVQKSSETVKQLGKNSDQIGDIVQVIDDIADQTNLLALNAAIEAARAGEQGRGFAVVADEVRKLAERTTKATKEIADMIKKIQQDTGEAVISMQKGTEEVVKGEELAGKAGASLKEIISATIKVVDDITLVATASEEQSATAEEISKNIDAIRNVTNETAAGIQQVAGSAEELNNFTDNLQKLVSNFKIADTSGYSRKSPTKTLELV